MQRTDTAQQPAQRLPGSTLLLLTWIALQRAYHRWVLEGDLAYLKACERDGLVDSLSMRAWRDALAERECRLIALDAQARSLRQQEVRA